MAAAIRRSRFYRFRRLQFREKMLFQEALLLHLITGLMVKILPFRRIPVLFGDRQSDDQSNSSNNPAEISGPATHGMTGREQEDIRRIRDAVSRAGRVSPWRNRCLISALAGRCMLRRRGIPSELSLGVAKGAEGTIDAHAWLVSGAIEIVEKGGNYTGMYRF